MNVFVDLAHPERASFNGDLDAILRPVQRGILNFTAFAVLAPHLVDAPARADGQQRAMWLAGRDRRLASVHGEAPIDVGRD